MHLHPQLPDLPTLENLFKPLCGRMKYTQHLGPYLPLSWTLYLHYYDELDTFIEHHSSAMKTQKK